MSDTENEHSGKFFLASPWLLATASLLLATIIGVFAVNNYQREKKLMNMALTQEGRAVLNIVSSGSRAAIRNSLMQGPRTMEELNDIIQQVIETGAEHQGIMSLFLVNESGLVVAHSDKTKQNTRITHSTINFLSSIRDPETIGRGRILAKTSEKSQIFQIGSRFHPLGGRMDIFQSMRENTRKRMGRMMRDNSAQEMVFLEQLSEKKFYLVAELDMTGFQHMVHQQFIYILILSLVLLLVGIGGFLSLIAIQGFKGSQQQLKRITHFTDILISSMPLGVVAISSDGEVRSCNGSGCQMLTCRHGEVIDKSYKTVFPEKVAELMTTLISQEGACAESDFTITTEKCEKNLHFICVPLETEHDKNSGYMLLIQDLTTQKMLEHEIRRNEQHTALGKMAAGVAHELRNPLSSIKGLALLLKSEANNQPHALKAADILISEVERLNRSISELLDYSRPDSLNKSEFKLVKPIKKAIVLIGSDAKAAQVTIIEHFENEQMTITGDRDKFTQLFLNLLLNSLQAMPNGGTIWVGTRQVGESVMITIQDNGEGIDEELKDKIFDPYVTTKNKGTGLGLSLSSKIVEDHGGSIKLESTSGEGTSVSVILPA